MNVQALEKLWRKSRGRIPHLNAGEYEQLCRIAQQLDAPRVRFWGLVADKIRFRSISVVHCFNFGNVSVTYPWFAVAQNFGHAIPLTITKAGTIRRRQDFHTILDSLDAPFLTFGFEHESAADERLEGGYLLTDGHGAEQVSVFDVIFPCADPEFSTAPDASAILFYFMMKRMPCRVGKCEPFVFPGEISGFARYRVTLRSPMIVEPGWIFLMLEKDRWSWGVACG